MILLFDSSTPTFKAVILDSNDRIEKSWEAGRQLSNNIFNYFEEILKEKNASWQDISGIGVFKGPGSYTGLRIGLTVANTLADSLGISIVGGQGDDWQQQSISRLEKSENDQIVMPDYGGEAHITSPRK